VQRTHLHHLYIKTMLETECGSHRLWDLNLADGNVGIILSDPEDVGIPARIGCQVLQRLPTRRLFRCRTRQSRSHRPAKSPGWQFWPVYPTDLEVVAWPDLER